MRTKQEALAGIESIIGMFRPGLKEKVDIDLIFERSVYWYPEVGYSFGVTPEAFFEIVEDSPRDSR